MKHELRANQIVGAGGVGAIVDIGDESFVVSDTTRWDRPNRQISIPRMESRLRRDLFMPPADRQGSRGHVLLRRFPTSLFCNKARCRKIVTRWDERKYGNPDGKPICPFCGTEGSLVPMRFVATCRAGHLSDVPWGRWVRHNKPECNSPSGLELHVGNGGTSGLESLNIKCPDCGGSRDLGQIVAKDAMKSIGAKCLGRHPWRYEENAQCSEALEVLQRGATNLYYPVTASALALEATEDSGYPGDDIRDRDDFKLLVDMAEDVQIEGNFIPPFIRKAAERLAEKYGVTPERILELLKASSSADPSGHEATSDWNEAEILAEEWEFLKSAPARRYRSADLVVDESEIPRFKGKSPFDRVLLLHRLREVRAFLGFRRVEPTAQLVTPDAGRPTTFGRPWLPAVEVFGEGIFLGFDEDRVASWEKKLQQHPAEMRRLESLEKTRQQENYWFLPPVTPRFVALHTLAHALMRQLVFESGYSSSALRERIYSGSNMAGMLIYTADGDSEGSLGGLVRQGQANRLGDTIMLCLDKAAWCSADPVCTETAGQGLGGFNRAACHACSLVPETSCTTANTLLDRGFLLGRDGMPGLLGDLL